MTAELMPAEQQLTHSRYNHILTNVGVWSHDGAWIYYDVRSDPAGAQFDGARIERVCSFTGEVEVVYESKNGAHCGVVSASPVDDCIVFIEGPQNPSPEWSYAAWHRKGMIANPSSSDFPVVLDARDLVEPYTAGALRGGTHLHVFSGEGQVVSFTYEDHVLETTYVPNAEKNQRNVGVAVLASPVRPDTVETPRTHPRNHDGSAFSVLVTQTTDTPTPGSDEISRAFSDAWVGKLGYRKPNGEQQKFAIACLGDVITAQGTAIAELFLVDLPEDMTIAGASPLEGTSTTRPAPPAGTTQRRLTFTCHRAYPGVGGVRHWPRSSPDGSQIAFLMKDDSGVVRLWTISPNGGSYRQLTHNAFSVESAFTWRPDGKAIACIADGSVCQIDAETGETNRLTTEATEKNYLRPEACVYSPSGKEIAYLRTVTHENGSTKVGPNASESFNQIFIVQAPA